MINALWLTVALTLSGAVFAPLDDDPNFIEAQKLYEDLEFEQAIFRLQAAALVPGRPAHEQARLFVWLGICYGQSGDATSARRAFADAVRADIEVALPVTVAPELEELLVAVRESEQQKRELAKAKSESSKPQDAPAAEVPKLNPGTKLKEAETDASAAIWTGAGITGTLVATLTAAAAGYIAYDSYAQATNIENTQVVSVAAEENYYPALYATGGALGVAVISIGVGLYGALLAP